MKKIYFLAILMLSVLTGQAKTVDDVLREFTGRDSVNITITSGDEVRARAAEVPENTPAVLESIKGLTEMATAVVKNNEEMATAFSDSIISSTVGLSLIQQSEVMKTYVKRDAKGNITDAVILTGYPGTVVLAYLRGCFSDADLSRMVQVQSN